ncbi:spore germination protein [Paenibacillus koleovorans]|uniref:spore germination protein n=1 Tax=Paenibacillus koleovorans TaxID=121608 RepID=UPI000FDC7C64|nr:spore germination protein [Paenibacillus koleovorans]
MVSEKKLRELFEGCEDVLFKKHGSLLLVYAQGLCDTRLMSQLLLPSFASGDASLFRHAVEGGIVFEPYEQSPCDQTLINDLFSGKLLVYLEKEDCLYGADLSNPPQRSTEESPTESSNTGPRDSFTESITTNLALVRKRLRTNTFRQEPFLLGKRTQTRVSLLYMSDITSNAILDEIRARLREIDIDAIYSAEQLKRLLSPKLYTLGPTLGVTTRPDMVLESLLAGRFALMMDGIPVAITGPVTLSYLLMTAEDVHTSSHHVAFVSLIRLTALFITLFLPGFWISLTTFHQDQIPFPLLATVSVASDGTPFNEPMELILVLLMFQLFIEAGNRLPSSIGSMLSVVGGLIIGDAAIRAGITSPATLLVAGVSSTSSFVLMPNALGVGTIWIRLFVLIVSSFFGLFGFLVSVFLILLYVSTIRTFGVPFLAPLSPFRLPDAFYSLFYWPWKKRQTRPKYLNVKDKDKQPRGGESG